MREHNKDKEIGEIIKSDSLKDIVEKGTYKNIISLEDTKNIVDIDVLDKCIDLLKKCENICIHGIGSSLTSFSKNSPIFYKWEMNCKK